MHNSLDKKLRKQLRNVNEITWANRQARYLADRCRSQNSITHGFLCI